jgi:hypothetical protein
MFALATDEGSSQHRPCSLWAGHRDEAKRLHLLRLPLQLERLDRLDLDRAARELHRSGSDVDLVRRRSLLESRRNVDGVAGDQPFACAGDHLARVDTDARLHAERRQRVAHLRGGSQCAQRVVLVQQWNAEHRHHRVADEFLDGPAMAFDDCLHSFEVACEKAAQRLGVDGLAEGCRAGDVAEDDRHRLPHLARDGLSDKRRCALETELRMLRIFGAAAIADHRSSLRRVPSDFDRCLIHVND